MTRGFVIITAAQQDAANALAASVFDTGGAGQFTFRAGLVPAGSPAGTAPTHYITSAEFEDAKWALLPTFQGQFPGSYFESYDLLSNPNAPWTYCASVGLQRPVTTLP